MTDPSQPNDEDLFDAPCRRPEANHEDPSTDLFETVACDRLSAIATWAPAASHHTRHVHRHRHVSYAKLWKRARRPVIIAAGIAALVAAGAGVLRARPTRHATTAARPAPAAPAINPESTPGRPTTNAAPPAMAANVALTSRVQTTGTQKIAAPNTPRAAVADSTPRSLARRETPPPKRATASSTPSTTAINATVLPANAPATPSVAERWARVTAAADAALALSRLSQNAGGAKTSDEEAVRVIIGRYRSASVSRDPNAARAVWPTADASVIAGSFDAVSRAGIDLSACHIRISGDVASVGCGGPTHAATSSESAAASQDSRTLNFDLSRVGPTWQINKVESR